ncbi:MAG: sigma-54 dependent transcriptional regulator [Planctomycetota bacterium]|nr:sigma-54 dependent transcriptional regulator [Planctomycetota bacterium]
MNSAPAEILIVDDVIANLKILRDTLEDRGHTILAASDGETALRIAADATPDLILLDVMMPGTNGYEVCRRLKENTVTKHIPVIFISAREDNESVLNGFRAGGVDYVSKPFEKEEVLIRVQTHLEISRLTQEILEINRVLQKEIERRELEESKRVQAETALMEADQRLSIITKRDLQLWGIKGFIGKSEAIGKIIANVRRLQEAVKTSVLITGESGTGKELIAIAIHFGGALANGPFIPVNCSAIPDHLAESAFFGHIKGAFTGATANQKGYFEQAAGGTLFLDEIGDMPQDMQSKLLRVLEDGYVTPVGDTRKKEVAVRVIAATNQDLEKRIAEKTFRSDLYFRLAGFPIHLPPLRERKDDIPLLAAHFLTIFGIFWAKDSNRCDRSLWPEVLDF